MGYCWKHFDILAGPKLLHTEIAIQHRLELCGINSFQKFANKIKATKKVSKWLAIPGTAAVAAVVGVQ